MTAKWPMPESWSRLPQLLPSTQAQPQTKSAEKMRSRCLRASRSFTESENVAADIHDQLAKIVGGLSTNKLAEDKLRDKLEAYARPGNCPGLVVARVNPESWDKLSPGHWIVRLTVGANSFVRRVQCTSRSS